MGKFSGLERLFNRFSLKGKGLNSRNKKTGNASDELNSSDTETPFNNSNLSSFGSKLSEPGLGRQNEKETRQNNVRRTSNSVDNSSLEGPKTLDGRMESKGGARVDGAGTSLGEYEVKLDALERLAARKPGISPRMWSAEEDRQLTQAVQKYGTKSWKRIAQDVPTRTHVQCLQRYQKVLRKDLVKGAWKEDEDDLLLRLIQEQQNYRARNNNGIAKPMETLNWKAIAEQITGRSAKQCRERWFLNLDPSINHGDWTQHEENRLLELYYEIGSKWSTVAKELPGRTENSVKTKFNSVMRREAKSRGWSRIDDVVFVQGLMIYGKDFQTICRLLLGRSQSQLRKRFNELILSDSTLAGKVNFIQEHLKRYGKAQVTPVHLVEQRLRNLLGVVWNAASPVSEEEIIACFRNDKGEDHCDSRYGNFHCQNVKNEMSASQSEADLLSEDELDELVESVHDELSSAFGGSGPLTADELLSNTNENGVGSPSTPSYGTRESPVYANDSATPSSIPNYWARQYETMVSNLNKNAFDSVDINQAGTIDPLFCLGHENPYIQTNNLGSNNWLNSKSGRFDLLESQGAPLTPLGSLNQLNSLLTPNKEGQPNNNVWMSLNRRPWSEELYQNPYQESKQPLTTQYYNADLMKNLSEQRISRTGDVQELLRSSRSRNYSFDFQASVQ